MQHVHGEDREERDVRVNEHTGQHSHGDNDQHPAVPDHVGETLADAPEHAELRAFFWRAAAQLPGHDHGEQEADSLELEGALRTDKADQGAADGRADDAHRVPAEGVQGDGVRKFVRANAVEHQQVANRAGKGFGGASRDGGAVDHPNFDATGGDEHREQASDDGADGGVEHQLAAAFEAAADVAADGREQDERGAAQESDCREVGGRAAEVVDDEPALANGLHPRANLEEHGAEQEDAEVAVAEGSKRATTGSQATPGGCLLGYLEGA